MQSSKRMGNVNMKPAFTYKQVQDALKAGYTSPLNHDRKASDISIVVTDAKGVPAFAGIEGVLLPAEMIQASFINAKKNNENHFATINYEIHTDRLVISSSVSLCQPDDHDLIADIHHRIGELHRHGKI